MSHFLLAVKFVCISFFALTSEGWGRNTGGIRVIGAGFPRTGTSSLTKALQDLGYQVYHGMDFHNRHREWALWANAIEEDSPGSASTQKLWNTLVGAGFNAFLDGPASNLWESQLVQSPNAKVILSLRSAHTWAESLLTIRDDPYTPVHGWWRRMPFKWIPTFAKLRTVMEMMHKSECGQYPCGKPDDTNQIEASTKLFEARRELVLAQVPKKQLLLWDPSDGWEPLCKFLEAPHCPDWSFPHRNQRKDWVARSEEMGKQTKSKLEILEYLWLPLLVLLFLGLAYAVRRVLCSFFTVCRSPKAD